MSETIELKVSDLVGPTLDWAAAKVEAVPVAIAEPHYGVGWRIYRPNFGGKYSPSTDWAVGGPLIEKHMVAFSYFPEDEVNTAWAYSCSSKGEGYGPTHLVAVCRAIVAAKIGDTVRIPAEFV